MAYLHVRSILSVGSMLMLTGCASDEKGESAGHAIVASHDVAVYFVLENQPTEARRIAGRAVDAAEPGSPLTRLLAHVEMLIALTAVGAARKTAGPLADGPLSRFGVAPYQDRSPTTPWRFADEQASADSAIAMLEADIGRVDPLVGPDRDPRFTYEIAARLANLDQHARVDSLLASVPEHARSAWWHAYIETISKVRRRVNANWQDSEACEAAVDGLERLFGLVEEDEALARMAPIVLFDLGMIARQMHNHRTAVRYLERATAHPDARGDTRRFLFLTSARL